MPDTTSTNQTKYKVGDRVVFRNDYAYPSLSGQTAEVVDVWEDENWASIKFADGTRMASMRSELSKADS